MVNGAKNFDKYRIEYYLCILKIELKNEKCISAPSGGPEWLIDYINYLLSEYSNSLDEIYDLAIKFSAVDDFVALKMVLKK